MAKKPDTDNGLLKAALIHAREGRPVFPCGRDKRPLVKGGFYAATTDPVKIERWWTRWPDALIGMPTGEVSGVFVVDLDCKKGKDGFAAVPDWETLSPVQVKTRSGGRHLYFRCTKHLGTISAGKIAPGVDTRGEGGYVIVPPSPGYSWANGKADFDDLPTLPKRLREALGRRKETNNVSGASDDRVAVVRSEIDAVDRDRISSALFAIPADCEYQTWFEVGCALYKIFGTEIGALYFLAWSSSADEKYEEDDAFAKWRECCKITEYNKETIFFWAREHQWVDPLTLPKGDWTAAARRFAHHCYRLDRAVRDDDGVFRVQSTYTLVSHRGEFFRWTGTHYVPVGDDNLRSLIRGFLTRCFVEGKDGPEPFNPSIRKVDEVRKALADGLNEDQHLDPPFWRGNVKGKVPADRLIPCRNGLLDMETRDLLARTPDFFTVTCVPVAYNPDAPKAARWLQFRQEVFPNDLESRKTLAEIFGYMLSGETRQEKIFGLIGDKRSGKGTIAWVLEQLLGPDSVVWPTIGSLATNFGRWPLINKKLAVFGDVRVGGRVTYSQQIVEVLLGISGRDRQTIDRKNLSPWTGVLGTRLLLISNEVPQFRDASGALASRFVMLKTGQSFFGKEDKYLREKLAKELPGILNWALAGLDRLRKRGRFEQPESALEVMQDLQELSSPLTTFGAECCLLDSRYKVETQLLYGGFRAWLEKTGSRWTPDITQFGRDLKAAFPRVNKMKKGGRAPVYRGITLNDQWEEVANKWLDTTKTRD